jgi:cytochrome c oxidase cbb3-type subunit 4
MDPGTIRGIGTLLLIIGFIGLCVWAYGPWQKKRFDEAARLPFADEDEERPAGGEKGRS